jgi:hypothetical protein
MKLKKRMAPLSFAHGCLFLVRVLLSCAMHKFTPHPAQSARTQIGCLWFLSSNQWLSEWHADCS